MIKRSRKTFLG